VNDDVAAQALSIANAAAVRIDTHEQVCADRYESIRGDLKTLRGMFLWAASVILATVISVLGWSLATQVDSAKQRQQALETQIQSMRIGAHAPLERTP
jgi:hypothetical protein